MQFVSEEEREDGAPVRTPRHRTHYKTDVNLAAATLAFRQRPLRIVADELAKPLRVFLISQGRELGECTVLDVSAGGIGIRLGRDVKIALGMHVDEVRLEQGEAIVAHGSADVVNLLQGAARRAGLRFTGRGVELRNLRLRDGAPVDPGGASPEAAALPADWRAAVAEFGQVLRWSSFFLDHATRPMGDQLIPAQEHAVFSDFFTQWGPRCLGSLGRLHDLSTGFDEAQREAARGHARSELSHDMYPGELPPPPVHGAIDDYQLPALFLSPEYDASTLHARFLRYAWARYPLIRTILARPQWLGELWDSLRDKRDARVLVVQPGPAVELADAQLIGGHRVDLTLLETDSQTRIDREPFWRERWAGRDADLKVSWRSPTGLPVNLSDEPPFDLIYGAGVLGGLKDSDARAVVRTLYSRLRSGGRLVLGNLRAEPATTWVLEYVFGWRLHYRDLGALSALAERVVGKSTAIRVRADPTSRASILELIR